ncbi:hypothetical protein [Brevibacillus centrosporus]|uniref:hypothetical protein n=1 Tax=Brevibacillus centrosporus TaxID=54910 RepID=UPI003987F4E6
MQPSAFGVYAARGQVHTQMAAGKQRMLEYGVPQYTHIFQNTKPLHTLKDYFFHTESIGLSNMLYNLLGNVGLFLPLGILVPILFSSFQSIHRVFFTV